MYREGQRGSSRLPGADIRPRRPRRRSIADDGGWANRRSPVSSPALGRPRTSCARLDEVPCLGTLRTGEEPDVTQPPPNGPATGGPATLTLETPDPSSSGPDGPRPRRPVPPPEAPRRTPEGGIHEGATGPGPARRIPAAPPTTTDPGASAPAGRPGGRHVPGRSRGHGRHGRRAGSGDPRTPAPPRGLGLARRPGRAGRRVRPAGAALSRLARRRRRPTPRSAR